MAAGHPVLIEFHHSLSLAGICAGLLFLILLLVGIACRGRWWWWLGSVGAAGACLVGSFLVVDTLIIQPRYDYSFSAADDAEYARLISGKVRCPLLPPHARDIRVNHTSAAWAVSCRTTAADFADFTGLWQEKADLLPIRDRPDLAEDMGARVGVTSLAGYGEFYRTPVAPNGAFIAALRDRSDGRVLVYGLRW